MPRTVHFNQRWRLLCLLVSTAVELLLLLMILIAVLLPVIVVAAAGTVVVIRWINSFLRVMFSSISATIRRCRHPL